MSLTSSRRALTGLALCAGLIAASAHAALTTYEGFGGPGYVDGALLTGLAGGSGWNSAWGAGNPLGLVTASGLTSGGLATTPGAATATAKPSPQTGADITFEQRQLNNFGADGTTVFFSFLTRPEAGAGFYGGINFGSLFIGKSGTTATYGLESGTGIESTATTAQTGETVLLVLRAQFLAGNDILELFVDPTLGGALPALADATMSDFDLGSASVITINNAGAWTVDELRVGDSYADVTPVAAALPEPPLLALLAAGLAALGLRRRHGAERPATR